MNAETATSERAAPKACSIENRLLRSNAEKIMEKGVESDNSNTTWKIERCLKERTTRNVALQSSNAAARCFQISVRLRADMWGEQTPIKRSSQLAKVSPSLPFSLHVLFLRRKKKKGQLTRKMPMYAMRGCMPERSTSSLLLSTSEKS
ncbi:hypothetical protein DI09_3p440 [Mitosporidium daphniae]|uniref:Uncharacterized protein n=1 Tax=Mitosporidium daphniae TaxID=1485682 RepID=A0A098VQH0_9MICR|nr:uncharacterized protein DI09_3p440 [Mitosporidium daphniae]KGG51282.1 hypothetical protein DI09_3p440 [Mitosporidium daphniae]|eukprot:XP_013237709.1 uncharacterized protein DI09_3p440 [Mitosporidium daphniae]